MHKVTQDSKIENDKGKKKGKRVGGRQQFKEWFRERQRKETKKTEPADVWLGLQSHRIAH